MAAPDWYLKHCEEQLQNLRGMLEPLESGQITTGNRSAGQTEWVDTTADRIAHLKRNIDTYERVIERIKKGE